MPQSKALELSPFWFWTSGTTLADRPLFGSLSGVCDCFGGGSTTSSIVSSHGTVGGNVVASCSMSCGAVGGATRRGCTIGGGEGMV